MPSAKLNSERELSQLGSIHIKFKLGSTEHRRVAFVADILEVAADIDLPDHCQPCNCWRGSRQRGPPG